MKVLKNGNDKTFITTCRRCESDLEYTTGDIITEDEELCLMNYIYCPICKNKIFVGISV